MIGRLILIILQVAACWFAGPEIFKKLPQLGQLNIFMQAVVFAILVWVVGVVGAIVLKDVAQPSASTLTAALIGALLGAALTLFPDVTKAISGVVRGVQPMIYPLIGAVLGYAIKR
jgi:hypothetical protein